MENNTNIFLRIFHPAAKSAWGVLSLVVLTLVGSFFIGRYPKPYVTPISDLLENPLAKEILLNIRMPRILTAFLLGMVLSASGTVFQLVFRNPLVDSKFIGVSGGAAFGASLAIVCLGGHPATVQLSASFFAFFGLAASYSIAHRVRMGDWMLRLILSGIAVSAIYGALTGALKYLADPLRELPEITFWLLGGIWGITWPDALQVLVVSVPCLVIIYMMRWRLNLLSMQDDTAFSLAPSLNKERLVLILAAVVSTAAVVSKSGQIAWVGLIVPHIVRRIVGSDAQKTLPLAMLLGGFFVLICDNIARTLFTGEIPLGMLTSFFGATIFIGLLMTNRLNIKQK